MMYSRFANILLALTSAVSTVSAASLYELASTTPDVSTLKAAIDAAGLADALSGDGSFTVFAPVNAAFAKIDQATIAKLLDPAWDEHLQDIILYHALGSIVLRDDVITGSFETLNGESIAINADDLTINGNSKITATNITADNGVIHLIDTVLLPTSATSDIVTIASNVDSFSTLVELVTAADLAGALQEDGPFTVFAPTNDAFAALGESAIEDLKKPENKEKLADILKYHVVADMIHLEDYTAAETDITALNGDVLHIERGADHDNSRKLHIGDDAITVNGAHVVTTVLANNGIIYVVDKVLEHEHDHGSSAGSSLRNHILGAAAALVGASMLL